MELLTLGIIAGAAGMWLYKKTQEEDKTGNTIEKKRRAISNYWSSKKEDNGYKSMKPNKESNSKENFQGIDNQSISSLGYFSLEYRCRAEYHFGTWTGLSGEDYRHWQDLTKIWKSSIKENTSKLYDLYDKSSASKQEKKSCLANSLDKLLSNNYETAKAGSSYNLAPN